MMPNEQDQAGNQEQDVNKTEMHSTSEEEEEKDHLPGQTLSAMEKGFAPDPNGTDEEEQSRRGRSGSHSTRHSEDSQRTEDDFHDHQVPQHRSRSRAQSSVRSVRPPAVKVARAQRRGLLARLCVVDEVTNAWDYSTKMKWLITAIVAVAGAAAPMGSAIVLPALVDITRDFNSTATVVNLSVAMYMLSMSIFPLYFYPPSYWLRYIANLPYFAFRWWSSFSETLGRRTIYVVAFFLFLVFNIISAVSVNIGMFIVMRVLSGGAAASVQAVGAGTIADCWETKERGKAMGLFYLGPLCGPLISPIVGGALAQGLGWRSTQWFLAIFAVLLFIAIVFLLPETLKQRKPLAAEAEHEAADKIEAAPGLSRTTTRQSAKIKAKKYTVMARRVFVDPLRIILYLQIPAVAILVAYAAITFGSLYVLNISVQQTFSEAPYNYSTIIVGLLYIPNSLGYFIASIFGGRAVDRIMHREAKKAGRYDDKGRLKFIPEDRMQENAWLGALLFPCALIAYGWTARYHVNVAAPMVANFFFGVGSMLIFALVTTMLTEFMPRKSSHGIALNNFVRNIFSCVGTIVTEPLIVAIGNGWLFLGLGVISLVAGCLTIWAMKRFGPHWRMSMDKQLKRITGE